MPLIQILIIGFAIFAIARAVTQVREGRLPLLWMIFWIVFWVAVSVVAWLPHTTSFVANLLGVGRGADLVVYVALLALFYLVFRLFVKFEDVEREITSLVRTLALKDSEEKKK